MRFCGEEKKTDTLTYNYNLWIDGLTRSITDLAYENDCFDYLTRDSQSKWKKDTHIRTARHIAKLIHYSSSSSKDMWLDKMRIKLRGANSVKETKTMNEKKKPVIHISNDVQPFQNIEHQRQPASAENFPMFSLFILFLFFLQRMMYAILFC